jgi:hypothetical protein
MQRTARSRVCVLCMFAIHPLRATRVAQVSRSLISLSLDVMMRSPCSSPIVVDGPWRILEGSGREAANRMRARFTRRTRPLVQQTSLVGRLFIRYRRERFIRRRMEKLPWLIFFSLDLTQAHTLQENLCLTTSNSESATMQQQSVLPQGTRTARRSCCPGGAADVRCRA